MALQQKTMATNSYLLKELQTARKDNGWLVKSFILDAVGFLYYKSKIMAMKYSYKTLAFEKMNRFSLVFNLLKKI